MIATLLLTLGLLLAPAGTFVYVYVGMTAPDPETLRLSKMLAVTGRWSAAAGCVLATIHGAGGHGVIAAVALAAMAATATYLTKLPPPRPARHA